MNPLEGASSVEPSIQASRPKLPVQVRTMPGFERRLEVQVREAVLLNKPPSVRSLGKFEMEVRTFGYKFPTPLELPSNPGKPQVGHPDGKLSMTPSALLPFSPTEKQERLRLRPSADTVIFKERLL